MERIAIIGLGLIGGCLGLDLTRAGHSVVGIARRAETAAAALALGAVTEAGTDLALVAGAEVVFICTPIDTVVATAEALVPYLSEGAVMTDVASVKGAIVPAMKPSRKEKDHATAGVTQCNEPIPNTSHIIKSHIQKSSRTRTYNPTYYKCRIY